MKTLRSYSSPFNFGHKALDRLFDGPVVIQEKLDGSQFSFGSRGGELFARSRNQEIVISSEDDSMFKEGLLTVIELGTMLRDGYTYRGEYFQKPKQNTLAYNRIPDKHIILFDVDKGDQDYMTPKEVEEECALLGLEFAPYFGEWETKPTVDELKTLLLNESVLGGQTIEGVVIKNYSQFGPDKKVLMGKYVSTLFKEKHTKDWKTRNPAKKDIIAELIDAYRTEARWKKAIQHLRENGEIDGVVQDIGKLIKEVPQDIKEDYKEEIMEELFKFFWPAISRGVTRGLPEFYKNMLMEEALE